MGNVKAKTLQQRFGFMDKDLKKPEHDEIMLWLDRELRAEHECISTELLDIEQWDPGEVDRYRKAYPDLVGDPPSPLPVEIGRIVWETPVTSRSGYTEYIIGFVDLCVQFRVPELSVVMLDNGQHEWEGSFLNTALNFEIKTEIPSLGELLRQIRMYLQYARYPFVVVSPEEQYAEQLIQQGIGFLHYDEGWARMP